MFLSSRSAPPCVRGASRHSEEQQYYYNDKYNIIASICVKKTESVIASRSQQQAGANGRARGAARLPPPPPLTSHGAGRDAPGHHNGRFGRLGRRCAAVSHAGWPQLRAVKAGWIRVGSQHRRLPTYIRRRRERARRKIAPRAPAPRSHRRFASLRLCPPARMSCPEPWARKPRVNKRYGTREAIESFYMRAAESFKSRSLRKGDETSPCS